MAGGLWYRALSPSGLNKTVCRQVFMRRRGKIPVAFLFGGAVTTPCPLQATAKKEAPAIVQIVVRDNNVEQALRALKKKMQREGTFREMKRRKFYEKPSEKRARQKAEAVRRARKLIRKRQQREGLI